VTEYVQSEKMENSGKMDTFQSNGDVADLGDD